ncbi:ABC transporter substrate-binding protein [Microbacterium deminutum]|uniref:Extracellular solute-binding protein n=1 Tax=Microbacterium deminutum TaxID=344164 RepID=A0ABP5CV83_9MICO
MFFKRGSKGRRRGAVIAGAAVVVALGLAGCSGGASGSSGGPADSGKVSWWSAAADVAVAEAQIAAFNKQYPNIKVTYKKVPTDTYPAVLKPALLSNNGPDVYAVQPGGQIPVATFGATAIDLTPAMKALRGNDWQNGLLPAGVEGFTVNGKLKAAAVGRVASGILWINQGLFDKYNLAAPTTLDEWVKVCKTFRENGIGCFKQAVGAPGFDTDLIHTIINSVKPGAFQDAVSGKIKWTDPAIVDGFTVLRDLTTDGIMDEGAAGIQQYPDVNNAFLAGKSPMAMFGTWYQQYTQKDILAKAITAAGLPSDTPLPTLVPITFPNVGGTTPGMITDVDYGVAVNSKSKNRNAATTFALWLGATKEGQQAIADPLDEYPVLSGVQPNADTLAFVDKAVQQPAFVELGANVDKSTEPRFANINPTVLNALIAADQSIVNGEATPEQAAATLQQVQDANPPKG